MNTSAAIRIAMLALAYGAASKAATAQSNLTIYGVADAGIVSERGGAAGNITKVSSGVASASRLGFRGSEDLGGGVSALFVLEAGISIDTGALASSSQAFNRQSFVGLKSRESGSLTIGRQYTLTYNALGQVGDPFGSGMSGSAKNLFPVAGANLRANNSIIYATPVKNGFSAEVLYSLGEVSGASSGAGRQYNVGLNYSKERSTPGWRTTTATTTTPRSPARPADATRCSWPMSTSRRSRCSSPTAGTRDRTARR